ncbi:type VI secretion system baseplate subunit TssE [Candidatus Methylocalor cossyra]|uniref:Type VI secretion system lysozyme-related protein n=1 Tax=Candidatus Methylocalor cossyra TaxID=3108543 RepID=A0ABP1C690_9GAMM
MAEPAPKDRLQPSLLDRLTDDAPEQRQEDRDKRVLTLRGLRQSVVRDLSWLLNSTGLEAAVNLEAYPEVAHSVLNYGIPVLAGRVLAGLDSVTLERRIRQAVLAFEPRLLPHSVKIGVVASDTMSQTALVFTLEGELWAQPLPLHLYIRTEVDLETGHARITDLSG